MVLNAALYCQKKTNEKKLWYGCDAGEDRWQVKNVPYVYGAEEERCFEYMCAGIGQYVVASIPSGHVVM